MTENANVEAARTAGIASSISRVGAEARMALGALVPGGARAWAGAGAAFALGALAAYLAVPLAALPRFAVEGPIVATLDGVPIPVDGASEEATRAAIQERAVAFGNERVQLGALDFTREVSRADLGVRVDSRWIASLARELHDRTGPLLRSHRKAGGGALVLPRPVAIEEKAALYTLLAMKDDFDRAPTDATFDLETLAVTPDRTGRLLDVHATLDRVEAAMQKGDRAIEAQYEDARPNRTRDALADVTPKEVLGYFETKYARDFSHVDRTYNLKLAASRLDGHVLLPGELFDFNEVVGPRSEAMGYRVATVISQGELVDGIGGGTCQIAGTLHGAAFFAGLDIVERHPHTRPSGYIKMGMDATVVYPTITLKLRNPYPYPVVLHETVKEGTVRAEILGPKRTRDVTFLRKITEVLPFQEKEVKDASIPDGERVLAQRGIPGFRVTRYRILRDGSSAAREKTEDAYPATRQIWKVGTGDSDDGFEPHDDGHPEYVADEWLTISQGPSFHSRGALGAGPERGGGMVESRVAGKTGNYGWTIREGLTHDYKRVKKPKETPKADEDKPGVD